MQLSQQTASVVGLQVLQQGAATSRTAASAASPVIVLRLANGATPEPAGLGQLESRGRLAAASLFDPSVPDATATKVRLMERLGEEFGLSMDDFASRASFGREIRSIVDKLKLADGGLPAIAEIEKNLGLDELGISLDALVNAAVEPGGADDQKLDAAIRADLGEQQGGEDTRDALTRLRFDDETGIYAF